MADSPASLRRKIVSAGELQSVVRAMKAQAAADVGQYERSVAALGDYAHTVDLGLCACLHGGGEGGDGGDGGAEGAGSAWLEASRGATPQRADRVVRAVVFGSDQGLVGRFNDTIAEHARQALSQIGGRPEIWVVGARVQGAMADGGVATAGQFTVPASVQEITGLVTRILIEVAAPPTAVPGADTATELHLFYNSLHAGSAYAPVSQRLLPLDAAWRQALAARTWPSRMRPQVLGPPGATLRALLREYLFVSIFRACAESLASENASRLAAMERADRNIDKMRVGLSEHFHRLRQARIDEELADVISGFQALKGTAA
jgi:F-type H+-transporting ATPase subunit gamma